MKVVEGKFLGCHPPEFFGLAQLRDHFEGNMEKYLLCEALIIHLSLQRQRDLGRINGVLRQGWNIILHFDNQLQGPNLLNEKVAEGKLLGRQ
jgi:hypothetical protein